MAVSKFLDPKNDVCFKRVFGTEKNKDILIHFLNDIFARQDNPIEEVSYLKTAQDPEVAAQRTSIIDIMCTDTFNNRFIVEMQVAREPGFVKRAQYYAAKAYIEQRGKEQDYKDLKQVTFLAITDFVLFADKQRYLSHHQMLDTQSYEHDLKDFSFSFLELPKFTKTKNQLKTLVEKWAYFFKYAPETQEKDLERIIGPDQIIKRAYEELDRYSWSPEALRGYDSSEMKQMADKAILEGAFEQGLEEGLEKGRAEGEARGLEKGKEELIRLMLARGTDLQTITTLTGLSLEELKKYL